ncbi:RING/U-box superfamily protein [Forsythia ovata]|uniref:RING/U-box superfamily protein n=1 Tax=Forsythia ovata TaxID=205694 RepID=A0ABD1WBQ8_9LAMI
MITLAKQAQSTVLEHDNQSIDGDGAARLVQLTSTRTTPSGSKKWRRVFSDTESDGFDSFYGENESNVSFKMYMHFSGEDDTISYTTYGGDSDASSVQVFSFGTSLVWWPRDPQETKICNLHIC